MSYKKMCGVIAKAGILSFKDGVPATAEEIFNYSSTGELYMIQAWFMEAIAALRMMGRLDNNDREDIKEFFGIDQGEPDRYGNTTEEAKNLAKLVDQGLINLKSENSKKD